jgi:DNA/RNA-binding domain of Phe-tRNA-synthetase-like protein
VLNIVSLPVFRDSRGAFGTPTSDSVRTSVTDATRRFMMVIIDFGISGGLETAVALAKDLLERHADARDLQIEIMN